MSRLGPWLRRLSSNNGTGTYLCAGAVLAALAFLTAKALLGAVDAPTSHIDGAFQTASAMYRIDAGQLPARDFYPYLGIGPMMVIFPIFKLAGADLTASVFAARWMTLIAGWFAVALLWHLILRPRAVIFSATGGAVVFILVSFFAGALPWPNAFAFPYEPGNSLRPLRAAVSYLAALSAYLLIEHERHGFRQSVLAGVFCGVVLLWSNDFAVSTAVLLGIFWLGFWNRGERPAWKARAATLLASAAVSWFLMVSVTTAGYPIEWLRFNFLDVAEGQWWYFAPYGPKARIFGWTDLPRLITHQNPFPLAVLAMTAVVAIKTRRMEHILLAWIGLALFCGGVVASLGGHLGGYFLGFFSWGVITAILASLSGIQWVFLKRAAATAARRAAAINAVGAVALCSLLAAAVWASSQWLKAVDDAKNDPRRFFVAELGGYLGAEWKGYVELARNSKGQRAIEEYWGIWSAIGRQFGPWPVDSVIHALGRLRSVAQLRLPDADKIVSTRFRVSPSWQPWNISQNFWFYEELLNKWEPGFISPTTVVWRRINAPRRDPVVPCHVLDNTTVVLAADSDGYYKVRLSYATSGSGRFLLMMRNNISFRGYMSLPTIDRGHVAIPARVTADTGTVFDLKVVGNPSVTAVVETCEARKIEFANEEVLATGELADFTFADPDWDRGIAREHAGYYVRNIPQNKAKHALGNRVQFASGDSRRIIDVSEDALYLYVRLNGAPLEASAVGLPYKFEVSNE